MPEVCLRWVVLFAGVGFVEGTLLLLLLRLGDVGVAVVVVDVVAVYANGEVVAAVPLGRLAQRRHPLSHDGHLLLSRGPRADLAVEKADEFVDEERLYARQLSPYLLRDTACASTAIAYITCALVVLADESRSTIFGDLKDGVFDGRRARLVRCERREGVLETGWHALCVELVVDEAVVSVLHPAT